MEKRVRAAGICNGRTDVISATSVVLHFESVENEYLQQLLTDLATRTRFRFHQIHPDNDAICVRAADGNFPMPAGDLPTELVTIRDTGNSTETLIMSVLDVGVTNRHIEEARAEMGSFGAPLININFTADGARRFGEITENMVGQRLAIVVDDIVLAAPSINEPIRGGQAPRYQAPTPCRKPLWKRLFVLGHRYRSVEPQQETRE